MSKETFAISHTYRDRRKSDKGRIKLPQKGHIRSIISQKECTSSPKLLFASSLVNLEVHKRRRHGPRSVEDISPIAYPKRHFPCDVGPPLAASDQPPTVIVPRCTFPPLALIRPSTSPRAGVMGRGVEAYFRTVACCRSCALATGSSIR